MPDTWFKVNLRQDQLHLFVELLQIFGVAEVELVGDNVCIIVDDDKLSPEKQEKVLGLREKHQFTLSIGDR